MSKKGSKYNASRYDDDGMRKQDIRDVKRDKARKQQRNLGNALRSRNLDKLADYEDD